MNNEKKSYFGLGKRKTSIASVFLTSGTGKITVNHSPFELFFSSLKEEKEKIQSPLLLLDLKSKFDIDIQVRGGGISGQLDAIKLAISKALCKINLSYRSKLHQDLFLRRDDRIKERRKYGLKKARKAPQYSKR